MTRADIPPLPQPRGPASALLVERLTERPHALPAVGPADDPLRGQDFHLALHVLYELHYRSFAGVDPAWEWEPSLVSLRLGLERGFEAAVREELGPVADDDAGRSGSDGAPTTSAVRAMERRLRGVAAADDGPALARYVGREATLEQFRELVVHRSAHQLKEADPHTWAIPRLSGRAKAALVEIQADEYGGGRPDRMHSTMYARTMESVGLDGRYGAYLDLIPGVTLATGNLVSLFGLSRRWRGAAVGHLAMTEMTSAEPNRRYGRGLRRLGYGPPATDFYDEHVEADSAHEAIAANDMAGSLAADEPALAGDIVFGARALLEVEKRFAEHVLAAWAGGESSLRAPVPAAVSS